MPGPAPRRPGFDGALEPIAENGEEDSGHIHVTVISFNFGIQQEMLESTAWQQKHAQKFTELMDT